MLLAHCGSNVVTEDEIRAVECPPWTSTWHPIPHGAVLDALEEATRIHGLKIARREYAMNESGTRFFGVWDLAGDNQKGLTGSIGFRSAIDKSMALGITVGTRVFVCDNLAFSGEFIAFRRHTKGLNMDSLIEMAVTAIKKGMQQLQDFIFWHESLALFHLTMEKAFIVTYRILSEGIVPGRYFNRLHNLLYKDGKYDPCTLWGQHEAATEILTRQGNLLTVARAHKKLNDLMDEVALEIVVDDHLKSIA